VTVRKIVHTIVADKSKDVAVFEHNLGPDVIIQVCSERGRVLEMRADVLPDQVLPVRECGKRPRTARLHRGQAGA
jgi:hypothetical protein